MHRDATTAAAPRTEERGQTMAEYAMVLTIITIGILLTIQLVGDSAGQVIEVVAGYLD